MPRYFFNIHHERSNIDPEGDELPDGHAAWREASRAAGEILRDCELTPGREWRLEVTDEFKSLIYVIRLNAERFG